MANELQVGFRLVNQEILDSRRRNLAGEFYADTAEVLSELPVSIRTQDQIFNVSDGSGGFVEYWFKDGTTDLDLVERFHGGSTGLYTPGVDLSTPTAYPVGGVDAGTLASTLNTNTYDELFDKIFFPTIEASIGSPVQVTLSQTAGSGDLEVGTELVSFNLVAAYSPGSIVNGDGSPGPNLKGSPIVVGAFTFSGTGISPTLSTSNTVVVPSVKVLLGINNWSVDVSYDAGTGEYYDSTGAAASNLDRTVGVVSDSTSTPTITGYRARWTYVGGSTPVGSATVRAKTISLDSNNSLTIFTGTVETKFGIIIPSSRTLVSVIDVSALNANITSDFVLVDTISVNDSTGTNPINYAVYEANIAGSFSTSHQFNITLS